MLEKEERLLMQDADEVRRNAEAIREMKLTTAVRNGVVKGRKRGMRRVYSYGAGLAAFAAAAVFITWSIIGSPLTKQEDTKLEQTASSDSVTSFDLFAPIGARDKGFAAAVQQNLLKPIKQGVEKDGYRIDVAGAVSDGRRAYIMFSVQNHTKHGASPIPDSLKFGDDEAPSVRAEAKNVRNGNLLPGETGYYVYSTNLAASANYSHDATLSVKVWDTVSQYYAKGLDISFNLDTSMLSGQEHVYHPEGELTIDGQTINVSQVQFTPLGTYVDLKYDPSNTKQIFKVISPVLIGKSGDKIEKLYYPEIISNDNTQATLWYKNSSIDQMETTSLKVFGIGAVEKDRLKIVIDLKKREIISAPDDKLQLLPPEQKDGAGEINFYRKVEHAQAENNFGMSLSDTFTDASGKKYKRQPLNKLATTGTSYSTKTDIMEDYYFYYFGEDAADYPQPLTIEVKKYWIPVMETQSIQITP